MTEPLSASAPAELKAVRTRPLFIARLETRPLQVIGPTPAGVRRVGVVPGGVFEGDRLSGVVLEGGADWQTLRSDGSLSLNVRLVLKTGDGALIMMRYEGVRHGPADVLSRIDRGEVVDPASYYFRINPLFETAAPQYGWLNHVVAVGIGHRLPDGPLYSVFEVL
jgi:hypothetical protein